MKMAVFSLWRMDKLYYTNIDFVHIRYPYDWLFLTVQDVKLVTL